MIQAPQGDLIDEQSSRPNDAQMERLKPFFPKSQGKPRFDDRRVLSGMIFVNRNGVRWCDAPKEYGLAKTFYNDGSVGATMASLPGS